MTIEKALLAERLMKEAAMSGEKLAKEVLNDFMKAFANVAIASQPPAENVDKWLMTKKAQQFEKWSTLAVNTAKELAKYQSPTMKAIEVGPTNLTGGEDDGHRKVRRFTLRIFDRDPRTNERIEVTPIGALRP